MRFALSDEQAALREAARAFLAELPGPASCAEDGSTWDRDAWARLVGEQGFTAILVPADAGGWGFGLVEAMVVVEEAGRAHTPLPLWSTMVATLAIAGLGDPAQQARWLGAIAGGRTATLATEGAVRATREGDGWTLHGEALRVVDGDTADVVVVVADRGVFVLDGDRVARSRVGTLDPTRPLATLGLDGVHVGDDARLAGDDLDGVLRRAEVLLAAEQVGLADATLALTVDHVKVRKQFGRPIGAFQAVQHAAADMLVRVETARSATWYAAWALDRGAPDAGLAARTAKAMACDTAFRCAGDAIQLHGGIGFTWEHALHLHFKRARGSFALLGEPKGHRAAVAAALLDAPGEVAWI